MTSGYLKKALIREEGYPVGRPGPMYLNCVCGKKLPVQAPFTEECVPCACGYVYDSRGWILNTGDLSLMEAQ